MQVEDIDEREEKCLRANIKGIVLVTILVPVSSHLLNSWNMFVAHSKKRTKESGTVHLIKMKERSILKISSDVMLKGLGNYQCALNAFFWAALPGFDRPLCIEIFIGVF